MTNFKDIKNHLKFAKPFLFIFYLNFFQMFDSLAWKMLEHYERAFTAVNL